MSIPHSIETTRFPCQSNGFYFSAVCHVDTIVSSSGFGTVYAEWIRL